MAPEMRPRSLGSFEKRALKSRKRFGPENPFQKLRSAYSKKLAFYYDFKIRKGTLVAKFHSWKRRSFTDRQEIIAPEIGPESFGTFEKRAPETKSEQLPA